MDISQDKSVVNLSSRVLNKVEVSILARGLSFCPTPKQLDAGQCRSDLDKLHRNLRLKAHFERRDKEDNNAQKKRDSQVGLNLFATKPFKHKEFKVKSKWGGPIVGGCLEAFVTSNERDFHRRPPARSAHQRNISPAEEQAILDLSNDNSIVIKPADKGSAVVVMDRSMYLTEAYKQLSDTAYYEKLDYDPTTDFSKQVHDAVEDMYQDGGIDESVRDYLLDDRVKTARFYLLPKIHKNKHPPPGRPVVSGNSSPTERISHFVDHFLQPCSIKVKSYLKDTNHFLRLIEEQTQLPDDVILVTMDVTALYTNIPTREGLLASNRALKLMRPDALHPRNGSIMRLLNMVLKRNNFRFNGTDYLQILGTAIGTKAAPSFAIIYMGDYEDKYVYTYFLQPLLYVRYIDDVFMIWQHGESELNNFVSHLNSCVDTIKFTMEFSMKSISFLDTRVINKGGKLYTDLYTKPTDTHDYLMYSSAHPQRCKDSIPYSQFLRVRRICSRDVDYRKNVMILSMHFLRRQYPQKLLLKAAALTMEKERSLLLTPKPKPKDEFDETQIFLTTTYHPTDNSVRNIAFQNWDILGRSEATNFLYQKRLRMGYRRPKNLRQLLVRANLPRKEGDESFDPLYVPPAVITTRETQTITDRQIIKLKQTKITKFLVKRTSPPSQTNNPVPVAPPPPPISRGLLYATPRKFRGFPFCNLKGNACTLCPKLNKTGKLRCHVTGDEVTCMKKISCRSSNLIYCITCLVCGKQYVGQTMRRLRNRFYTHYYLIKESKQDKSVSRHLTENNHNVNWNFSISVLEFIKVAPDGPGAKDVRDRTENKWIHWMRTSSPDGLNLED